MPLQYKIPGYLGNLVLLLLAVIILFSDNAVIGLLLGALALLNLYLVYKLDAYSQPQAILAHELEMAKMREALLLEQKRVAELQGGAAVARSIQAPPAAPTSP